jgi:lysozyme
MLRGIDVSHHQGVIDWERVRAAGVAFAYVKTTDGVTFQDPLWRRNRDRGRRAGLAVGGYHYARPNGSPYDAAGEATAFAAALGPYQPGDLPPALDLEEHGDLPPRELVAWAVRFLTRLDDLSVLPPVLYTGSAFHTEHLASTHELDRWRLWIAHYTSDRNPRSWRSWTLWQHTSKGRVPGIDGAVDLDWLNGDAPALAALTGMDWEEWLVQKLPTLRRGATGEHVGTAQALANARGANPPLALDNAYGPKTAAAIRHLTGRDVVDHTTWAKLLLVG